MSNDLILNLIASGESEELELKTGLRDPGLLARLISSFANANGGKIIIGAKESGEIVGVAIERIQKLFVSALSKTMPAPNSTLKFVQADNKDLAIIDVEKSNSPVIAEGGFFIRSDTITRPISPSDISFALTKFSQKPEIEDLYKSIAKQTEIVESLREELKESNSFKSKLKDYLIGGLIGAVIGLLLSLLSGGV